jgi:hypothetical protein
MTANELDTVKAQLAAAIAERDEASSSPPVDLADISWYEWLKGLPTESALVIRGTAAEEAAFKAGYCRAAESSQRVEQLELELEAVGKICELYGLPHSAAVLLLHLEANRATVREIDALTIRILQSRLNCVAELPNKWKHRDKKEDNRAKFIRECCADDLLAVLEDTTIENLCETKSLEQ